MPEASTETFLLFQIISAVVFIISTVATFLILLAYIKFSGLRATLPLRLIGYLSFANLGYSISGILRQIYLIEITNDHINEDESVFHSDLEMIGILDVIGYYFRMVGWIFGMFFTYGLYSETANNQVPTKKYECIVVFSGFGFPFLCLASQIIELQALHMALSSIQILNIFLEGFLALFIFAIEVFYFTKVLLILRQDLIKQTFKLILRNLAVYPIAFMIFGILWIILLIQQGLLSQRGEDTQQIDDSPLGLWIITLANFQPLVDAIIFGFNTTLKNQFKKKSKEEEEGSKTDSVILELS